MSENKNIVERHGCIVCGKIINVLAVHTPDGRLLDWSVTSAGGRRVLDDRQPLVACDTHTNADVEVAHKKWSSRLNDDQEDK